MREGGEGEVSHILSENINLNQFLSSTEISRIGVRKSCPVHTSQIYAGSNLLKYNQYQLHHHNEWLDKQPENLSG